MGEKLDLKLNGKDSRLDLKLFLSVEFLRSELGFFEKLDLKDLRVDALPE